MAVRKMKSLKSLKKNLKQALPQKIAEAIASYNEFTMMDVPEDAKSFSAHHSACKSAMAHIDALLKLARWSEEEFLKDDKSREKDDLSILLKKAKEAIGQEGGEDD